MKKIQCPNINKGDNVHKHYCYYCISIYILGIVLLSNTFYIKTILYFSVTLLIKIRKL